MTKDHSDQTNDRLASTEPRNLALIVDDDVDIRMIITETLTRIGYDVDSASTADEAISLFEHKAYDVVLSDWQMPGMNGIDLINRLRQVSPTVGTILMTGYGTEETVIDAFTRGKINYYLSKPFKLEDLMETVSATVREHRLLLSEKAFRERLEQEIHQATSELEHKNLLLQEKHAESENLYRKLQAHQIEIQETKEYLESLIESSVDAIISTDVSFSISLFSRGAEEMFRRQASEYLGSSIATLFANGQETLERVLELLNSNNRMASFETEVQRSDGERLFTDISVSRLVTKEREQGHLFIIKDISERKRLEEELRASNLVLERLSVTDGLTKLYNHRHFQECLKNEFERASRFGTNLGLIMIDLDDFKLINDNYGHLVGDQVLAHTSELIRQSIRRIDTPARYGGEEFTVILPQTNLASSIQVAQRIKDSLEHFTKTQTISPDLVVTASVGVSGFIESKAETTEELIRYADQALYRAKQIGKNRIVIGRRSGLEALGGGERLSQAEKHAVLRRVSQRLRGSLNLEEVLDYFLREITTALGERPGQLPCSITLVDENRQLIPQAEINTNRRHREHFIYASQQAFENNKRQVFNEQHPHGPTTTFPIIIETQDLAEEVIGTINIGGNPPDLDFIQDLVNHAALGIKNAKLYREMELSKTALERKVNELTYLSLMDMALQRNARTMDDFEKENWKLITRCVTQIGFTRAIYFEYDERERALINGVDNSLRGELKRDRLSLADLGDDSPTHQALGDMKDYADFSQFWIQSVEDLPKADRAFFAQLNITSGMVALAPMDRDGAPKKILIAVKDVIKAEDKGALSLFVLHASMITENLSLTALYREKTHRLFLLYEIAMKLALASPREVRPQIAQDTIDRLIEVLKASDISLYMYNQQKDRLGLVGFKSETAKPDQQPAQILALDQSAIMGNLIRNTQESLKSEPLLISDIKSYLGSESKDRYATNSYLGVPLVAGGQVLGIMNITDKQDQTGFNQDDLELAQTAAGMLASTLYQHLMLDRMEKEALESCFKVVRGFEAMKRKIGPGHSERVARISSGIARAMELNETEIEKIYRAAFLHDIGKIGLQNHETELLEHPRLGMEMVRNWLSDLTPGILYHHERMDGKGFPDGIAGPEIPLPARIIAAADFLDNHYLAPEPEKQPALAAVLKKMIEGANTRFDEQVVEYLIRALLGGMVEIDKSPLGAGSDFKAVLADYLTGSTEPPGSLSSPELRKRFLRLIQQ